MHSKQLSMSDKDICYVQTGTRNAVRNNRLESKREFLFAEHVFSNYTHQATSPEGLFTLVTTILNLFKTISFSCHYVRMAKRKVVKFKLAFIGHSGSNHSAFYLYRATSVSLRSNLFLCTCASM